MFDVAEAGFELVRASPRSALRKNGAKRDLDPEAASPEEIDGAALAQGRVAFERQNVLVDGIDNVGREGKETVLDFVGGSDPIARSHHHWRSVQFVKSELADPGGDC